MKSSKVVSKEEWIKARRELLRKEKEFGRLRDELSRERRALPRIKVEKEYLFQGPLGTERLGDLFAGRKQLVVYHFMFGPDADQGCPGCSHVADSFQNAIIHLANRDVTLLAVSRAAPAKLEAFKKRMGWEFKWLSSAGSDFNYDFNVSARPEELSEEGFPYNYDRRHPGADGPGVSVFLRDADGGIFHTYSTYARGLDPLIVTYQYLDLTPLGRNEEGLTPKMGWVRHHDRYDRADGAWGKTLSTSMEAR